MPICGHPMAWREHFCWIRERLGPMRVALLPIGAYLPRWFMAPVHLSPGEAVWAHLDLKAAVTIPIHYGTFPAADDGPDRPLADLRAALATRPDVAPAFVVLEPGQAWVPVASSPSSWTPPPAGR
ncbi:MAG: MBL fold metallo-hydrolase, partial [Planctomycetes bacterium]|nr:MBL fold metallo-hydrolase [Planctomycetota bacterium]